jgi:hypothetical protein
LKLILLKQVKAEGEKGRQHGKRRKMAALGEEE